MPPPKSGQRSMTFTGNRCWTCKRRKVKCDERSSGCGNCEKMKIPCEGYGIKLQWINVPNPFLEQEKPGSSSNGRGRIRIGRDTGPEYQMRDIDSFLASLEEAPNSKGIIQQGPFSLFQAHDGGHEFGQSHDLGSPDVAVSDCSVVTSAHHSSESTRSQKDATASPIYTDCASSSPSFSTAREDGSPNQIGLDVELIRTLEDDHATPEFQLQEEFNSSLGDIAELLEDSIELLPMQPQNDISYTRLPRRISTSISGDAVIDRLMHHYVENIASLLQPIPHPQNPYRKLYVPAALQAISEWLPKAKMATPTVSSVIFHSLIASSAFHLGNCGPEQAKYLALGSQHRQVALHCLQSAINPAMATSEYKLLMVAMLSMVTISNFTTGSDADFVVHLQGTKQLRKTRRRWNVISRATRQLNEISDFLYLLTRTVSFSFTPGPWPSEGAEDIDEPIASQAEPDSCFGYMYGITPAIAVDIEETCRLAEYLLWYEGTEEPIPEGLLEACESLGDRLCNWSLDLEDVRQAMNQDAETLEIFQHHANAWHLAAVIYYHRRIQKCHSENHQQLLAEIAEHMHAVEDIKTRSKSTKTNFMAPITWPAFVASCDASERGPWEHWWERIKCYRVANSRTQWKVVQRLWERRDELEQAGVDTFDWIQAFKDFGIALFPI
ncbi:hypothetical protein CNYM01_09426 [Colletotrichum nymphaeae SA-01]|uniref:Zn(2)-C6 fungal-type domain-containing protein n=1 Tax=Colletotrichum nymphaeae SA-01 TaxID=1460502 RepID=A0A135RTI2_9PEZI|nr:hypothetical protein CNYM01_09426 [Colletotrichum nymphaeae SA-01]